MIWASPSLEYQEIEQDIRLRYDMDDATIVPSLKVWNFQRYRVRGNAIAGQDISKEQDNLSPVQWHDRHGTVHLRLEILVDLIRTLNCRPRPGGTHHGRSSSSSINTAATGEWAVVPAEMRYSGISDRASIAQRRLCVAIAEAERQFVFGQRDNLSVTRKDCL